MNNLKEAGGAECPKGLPSVALPLATQSECSDRRLTTTCQFHWLQCIQGRSAAGDSPKGRRDCVSKSLDSASALAFPTVKAVRFKCGV